MTLMITRSLIMRIQPDIKFQLLLAFISLVLNPTKLIAGTLSVNNLPPGVTVSISNNDRSVIINKNFFNLSPIDITFTITNDGGQNPDRYRFTDSVDNSTNQNWTDYHLELGFLDANGKFRRSGNDDLLDFGTGLPNPPAPPPTSDPFGEGQRGNNGNTIDYPKTPGPTLDKGNSGLFLFNVDVPDNLTNFTLRQQPTVCPVPGGNRLLLDEPTDKCITVPEPSSLLYLFALGTLGAASTLKRKLKPSKSSEKETTTVS